LELIAMADTSPTPPYQSAEFQTLLGFRDAEYDLTKRPPEVLKYAQSLPAPSTPEELADWCCRSLDFLGRHPAPLTVWEATMYSPIAYRAWELSLLLCASDVSDRIDPSQEDRGRPPAGKVLQNLRFLESACRPTPAEMNAEKPKRAKKSTSRGDARTKLIAEFTRHHRYAEGGIRNSEPVQAWRLATDAKVAESSASDFFKKVFGGYTKYCAACRDGQTLVRRLRQLNGDYSDDALYDGRRPPHEGGRDDEK
jgi:hypothetical protein